MDENQEKKEGLFGSLGKIMENIIFEKSGEEDAQPVREEAGGEPREIKPAPKEEPAPVVPDSPRKVDRNIYDKLKAALDEKDNAYTLFSEMFESLSEVIADEATRYAAALKAVGKTGGVTLDRILADMDDSLKTLEGERNRFAATIQQSEEELAKCRGQLREKDEAIASLRKQAEAIEAEKKDIERSVTDKTGRIETVRQDFNSAVDMVKAEVNRRKETILKYLQGGKQ